MNSILKTEIIEVSEKFRVQLKQLLVSQSTIEENEPLQDRVKKGCIYFSEKIESVILKPILDTSVDTDNKAVRKQVTEQIERINR